MTRAPIRRYEMNARASSSTSTSRSWAASQGRGLAAHGRGRTPRAPKEHGRLRLRPHRHRRLLPARLLRGAGQRAGGDRSGILAPSRGLLRRTWHHRRTGALGQRLLLSLEGVHRRFGWGPPQLHQAYRPRPMAKRSASNRTSLAEWAYARTWTSEGQRNRALAHWLHIYNHHRHHHRIGGPPMRRVGNVTGHYI